MDNIWISLDNEGSVVSVSQLVRGSANCQGGLSKGDVDALDEFNTDVVLRHVEAAPIPDTASFIQKMERERESREKGETKDTRGFFAKYVSYQWSYGFLSNELILISASVPIPVDVHRACCDHSSDLWIRQSQCGSWAIREEVCV